MLEKDIGVRRERLGELEGQAVDLVDAGHFDPDAVRTKKEQLDTRYLALEDPLTKRRQELELCLEFFQFNRDVDDELVSD